MRSTQVLAQLALLTSPVHAFYPFRPKWVTESEERRSLELADSYVGGDGEDVKLPMKQRGGQVNLSSGHCPRSRFRQADFVP